MDLQPIVLRASLGAPDMLFLMVLALVVFGPRRLPEIGKQIGKLMYEFRKASNDFKLQIDEELRAAEEADRQKKLEQERQAALALTAGTTTTPAETSTTEAAVATSEAPSSETTGETMAVSSSGPTIMPPSTGEPVSTSKPNFSIPNDETTEAAPLDSALKNDTPAQVALESGEAAPNHG